MADANGGNTVSAMLYQGVGMIVICVIFLIVWLAGCRRQQRQMLENMNTPLLSYVCAICFAVGFMLMHVLTRNGAIVAMHRCVHL